MPSKARFKYIKSLQLKKYRKEEQCFVVEGAKNVEELLHSGFDVTIVAATHEFSARNEKQLTRRNVEIIESTEHELSLLGSLQTNNAAIAVARMKPNQSPVLSANDFALALDNIRDPGNLGTIIRTADWFGISSVIASEETADFYNSKTISATMGSFCRVNVFYTSLLAYLKGVANVYGTFLEGQNIHDMTFTNGGIVVIGNESGGISPEVERLVHHRITIPRYGHAESLNAGMATGIILDNLRRSQINH
jgi:TrmH family RNA methyltransferase